MESKSALLKQILDDIKAAMKSHDAETLSTLRTLHSDIKNVAINSGKDITDELVIDALSKSVKQKNESIELLHNGGRNDQIPAEEACIKLYQKYLPAAMNEADVVAMIAEVKTAVGAASPKDMGKMMKELSPKLKGRFDSRRLSELVQAALK